jgi:branched-chain amino acid transport system substrate-binding protein
VWDDNASASDQSAKVTSKLINQDHVDIIIGSMTSSNTIAMAKLADEAQIPMISPAATNPAVTLDENKAVRPYVFRACFTDDFQGEGIADFIVNGPLKAKTAVIFYDGEQDYSRGIWETVKRVAASKGLTIVGEDQYLATSEPDFRTKLNKFKSLKFDVMIVPGYYNQVALIANQARELGIMQPLIGGDGWDSPDLWKVAGKNIEGCYFTNHYASDDQDPAVQDFIRKYKERNGGVVPDSMAILGYDATKLAADAITRAGSTDPAAVAQALAQTVGYKGAAGLITMNDKHNATKKLVVLAVGEGGATKWVYTYDPAKTAAPAPETAPAGGASSTPPAPPAAGGK